MMDLVMVGTLLGSFGLLYLLVRWCSAQLDADD